MQVVVIVAVGMPELMVMVKVMMVAEGDGGRVGVHGSGRVGW